MGIADFFRPKYRHSDSRVRLEAVRALRAEDSDILASIARTDRELSVRRAAIERIDEARILADLAADVGERTLKDLAGSRAAEIWVKAASQDSDIDDAHAALDGLARLGDQHAIAEVASSARLEGVRSKALDHITDARALGELAKSTTHPVLRAQALAAIHDPDVLRAIAVDTQHRELGLSALERVTDAEHLETIAQKAKQKPVRQRARKRLDEAAEALRAAKPKVSDDVKRRRAEQAQLLRELEGVVETHDWERSGPVVAKVESTWTQLGKAEDAALQDRFVKGLARYRARRGAALTQAEQQRQELEARQAAERAYQDAERARRAAQDAEKTEKASSLEVEVPTGWAAEKPTPERAAAPAVAVESEEDRAAREAERVARKKEAEERGAQVAASMDALISDLVSMQESNDGRAIDRLLGQASRAFEAVVRAPSDRRADLETRYREARAALVIRVQELREADDWQRWSNVPRAEALIKEAQALLELEAPDLTALKALQQRWKSIGAIPHNKNKELWELFKATCDQVFEKVKLGRAAEQEQHAGAVKVKEELIARAEALSESTDWEATAEALKELQRLWKESGTVPRRVGDALWRKFRGACDRFFERRKPILEEHLAGQEENLAAKRALIARAEGITAAAPGEAGWGPAIDEIKQLQRQWKDIGHVPRKDADEVYRAFRAACDGLFDKRDAARDAEADGLRAELGGVRAELDAIAGADPATAVAKLLGARTKLRDLGERGVRADDELAAAMNRATRSVIEAHPAALADTELDPAAMTSKRTKLVARAEELLPKARPGVEAGASAEQIVAQLKSAIASNALGDFRGAGVDPFEAVDELRAQWSTIGPVVGADAEESERRFQDACERILEGAQVGGKERREREPRGERDDRPRRERRPRRDRSGEVHVEASSAAAVVHSAPDAVTVPNPVPVAVVAPQSPPAPAAVAKSTPEPSTPAPEALKSIPEPAPQAAAPDDGEDPTAAAAGGEGAPDADAIDAGWD